MARTGAVGREAEAAFDRRAWSEAFDLLDGRSDLGAADLERLAVAAHLTGRDRQAAQSWQRAHDAWLAVTDRERAARCAFWLGLSLMLRGDEAPARGWLARGERLVAKCGPSSVARGLLLVPTVLQAMAVGDLHRASGTAAESVAIAERADDPDLLVLAVLCSGQVALADGDLERGMRRLDEVMVLVGSGDVAPIPAGIAYCAVIEACMDVLDVRRAGEWTAALADWCADQPDLVPYRGQCLVHRAQILHAHGDWDEAAHEIALAEAHLSAHPALGLALYEKGEQLRVRGEHAAAEAAYRGASLHGREPVPGLALLRLAEGNVAAAIASVRRLLDEHRPMDATALAAAVEILLAGGDVAGADRASRSLAATAASPSAAPLVGALADFAAGSVLLARGEASAALAPLRRAGAAWQDLAMPYEVARARARIAVACAELGDRDAAELEHDAARATFSRLGAAAGLDRVGTHAGLTAREREVVRLVAAGRTNQEIGRALRISTHTVARHLQNIFVKLGVSSRVAVTAYAYEHQLV